MRGGWVWGEGVKMHFNQNAGNFMKLINLLKKNVFYCLADGEGGGKNALQPKMQ